MICAGNMLYGGEDACQGDSGGTYDKFSEFEKWKLLLTIMFQYINISFILNNIGFKAHWQRWMMKGIQYWSECPHGDTDVDNHKPQACMRK